MRPLVSNRSLALPAALFLAASAVAMGLAFAASDLLDERVVSIPLLVVLLAAGVLAFLGWSDARARADEARRDEAARRAEAEERARREAELAAERDALAAQLQAAEERAATERSERDKVEEGARALIEGQERTLRETREELERKLEERNQELVHEQRARARAEQARRDEKEWALHLRKEVMRLQKEHGPIGDTSDVRQLVLRVAINLVGATKGLLLSREDLDSDGDLDLIHHEGFENDPEDGAVAERFAREVLRSDATVREDEPDIAPERRTAADEEIKNLLAIPIYIADKFGGVVVLANKDGGFHEYDDDVLLALGNHAGAVLHNQRLQEQLRTTYVGTVRVLADAIEAKDRFLRGHADEVSSYVAAVAERLGLEPQKREELVYSSLLHDIGKIGISERILMKPGELTPEERSVIQLHPRIGYRLVQQVPALRSTQLAILHHHERFDGEGYPAGLRGDEIPMDARIIAIADAFSAMTADRPYRRRMSLEDACAELERCAGTQFDPIVVRLFVEEVRRNPPRRENGDALHEALADPELDASKDEDDPILGAGAFAVTDNLTLLYSHRYFHEAAEAEAHRAAVQGRAFSVVMVEIAEMARINREQGYAAGDEAIKRVAKAVERAAIRTGGTACRDNGRRIALLAPADEQAAEEIANEIANDLADGPSVRIVTSVWRQGESGEDVISRARGALAPTSVP